MASFPLGDNAVQQLRALLKGEKSAPQASEASAASPAASATTVAAASPAAPAAPVSAVAVTPVATPTPAPLKQLEEVETFVPSSGLRSKAPVVEAPVVKEAKEIKEPKEAAKAPDEASVAQNQAGQAWVRQMPAGTFLVQHTIVPSYAEANAYMQAHPNLKRARIVANYLPNLPTLQFSVVSGPFGTLGDASAYADSAGVPKDPQIRSARFMKEQFSQDNLVSPGPRRAENKR